jgi:iron complex outermembrane receptor protein
MNQHSSVIPFHSKKLNLAVSAIALAVAAVTSPAALAQQKDGIVALEEVIVTARKREESIQDVPISVTSIGKELKEASLRRLDDIQSFTPNVYIRRTTGTPGGAAISIRGVSYQETDKSYDPSIGVIMDGMYLGTSSGSMLQNFDTARIEVLRGPQGTLFGKNTVGGVINVIRSDVTMEWGGDASITVGEDGREDFKGVLNVPIIEDKLGVKLFANDINSDGQIRNTTLNKDVGGDDYQTYGFATKWNATDDLSFKFHYEHNKNKTDAGAWSNENQSDGSDLACSLQGLFTPVSCADSDTGSDKDHVSSDRKNKNDSKVDSYIATINWDFDSFLLTSITAYRDQDEHFLSPFDSTAGPFLYLDYYNDWEQTSQELRLTSQFSETIDFVTGVYYWDVDYKQNWDVGELHYILDQIGALNGVPGGLGLTPDTLARNGQDQSTTSYAAFFSGDYHINDQWTITAGLRYTYEEKDFGGGESTFYQAGQPTPELPWSKFDDDWDEWSPKVGFSYDYNDDIMIFGSYAEGFKSGGFFGRQAGFDGLDPQYEPEYVDNYELGMKSTWLDGRLIFNPTVFYSNYDDKQEEFLTAISLSNVATVVRNASTLEIYGAELEVQFQVTEGLNIRAMYGYLNAEYDDYIADINGDGNVTDNSDLTPRNTPENTFGFSTTYTIPIGPGEFWAYASYRWRDEIETIANNDPLGHLDSIENVDFTVNYSWSDGRYRVSAYGRNITDERERTTIRITDLTTWGQWNESETYGVEIAASF